MSVGVFLPQSFSHQVEKQTSSLLPNVSDARMHKSLKINSCVHFLQCIYAEENA